MERRAFVAAALIVGVVGAPPLSAEAQQPAGKVYRIGLLSPTSAATPATEAFREGLRDLGWIEGQTIVIEHRFAEGRIDRLSELAAELVRLKVDVIAAGPTPPAVAAKNATRTIPIVMLGAAQPVEIGLVVSLARPGGNVTGMAWSVNLEIIGKALELLKEAAPKSSLVAVLWNPANPGNVLAIKDLKHAAGSMGAQLHLLEAREPAELDGAFAAMARRRADALLVVADALFLEHRARLADLARRHRLPSMFGLRQNVEAGGLMSYGPNTIASWRRAASFVDRILKGARPADLPVEQPTKFDLVINLKTAKALGLAIPPAVLARADEVIQ